MSAPLKAICIRCLTVKPLGRVKLKADSTERTHCARCKERTLHRIKEADFKIEGFTQDGAKRRALKQAVEILFDSHAEPPRHD